MYILYLSEAHAICYSVFVCGMANDKECKSLQNSGVRADSENTAKDPPSNTPVSVSLYFRQTSLSKDDLL